MDIKAKLTTWEDADLALCDLGMYILASAAHFLRHPDPDQAGAYPSGDLFVENGYLSNDPNQSWWSMNPKKVHTLGLGKWVNFPDESDEWPSAVCWYSFQNIVRARLRQARSEIMANRYIRKNKAKASTQASRNPTGRKKGSKFNRKSS